MRRGTSAIDKVFPQISFFHELCQDF